MVTVSKPFQFVLLILRAFMVLVYFALGSIFLFLPHIAESIHGIPRYLIGVLIIVYALFRLYRIFKMKREENDED